MKPYRKENIPRAKELRKNMTPWERKLWYEFLRNYPLRFQRQKAIGDYIADFYCAKAGLVVELDGGGHYEAPQAERDRNAPKHWSKWGCGSCASVIWMWSNRFLRYANGSTVPFRCLSLSRLRRQLPHQREPEETGADPKNKPPSDEGGGTAPAVTEGENTATRPVERFGRKSVQMSLPQSASPTAPSSEGAGGDGSRP